MEAAATCLGDWALDRQRGGEKGGEREGREGGKGGRWPLTSVLESLCGTHGGCCMAPVCVKVLEDVDALLDSDEKSSKVSIEVSSASRLPSALCLCMP